MNEACALDRAVSVALQFGAGAQETESGQMQGTAAAYLE